MPIWSEIGREIYSEGMDEVRRKYLIKLHRHQDKARNIILYASNFVQKDGYMDALVCDEDMQALMEVSHGLDSSKGLDLILHSSGGSVEAAESMVIYLREHFSDLRVIVPHLAMSAATMIACAADKIYLGKHSFLGPPTRRFSLPRALAPGHLPRNR